MISRPSDDPLAHLRPALALARYAGVRFDLVGRNVRPSASIERSTPFVAVLCDDTGEASGPSAFHRQSLELLLGCADTVIVHAWATERLVYVAAVMQAACSHGGVIVVETRLSHEMEWISLFGGVENIRLVATMPARGIA